jgi:hypothetical protein
MARFKDIVLNEEEGTVEIGAGLTWTEVYAYLVPKGLTVVGGRINDVGVSGFTLGGGRHTLLCRVRIVFAHRDAPRGTRVQDILGRPISMVSQ